MDERLEKEVRGIERYQRRLERRGTKLRDLPKGSRVLEIGIGTAHNLERDKKRFPHLKWFGTSWKERAYHSYWTPETKKLLVLAEGANLPFKTEKFDAVIVRGSVLPHINKKREFLKEVHRVLKTGGRAVIHAPVTEETDSIEQKDGRFDKSTISNHREIKLIERKQKLLRRKGQYKRALLMTKISPELKFRDKN